MWNANKSRIYSSVIAAMNLALEKGLAVIVSAIICAIGNCQPAAFLTRLKKPSIDRSSTLLS
jgi:hypothetical protein